MKILVIVVILAVLLIGGYFLIAPAFKTIEVEEESPLKIRDTLDTMTDEKKAEFERQTEAKSEEVMVKADTMPGSAQLVSQGIFKPRAHDVEGRALLIEENGKQILRFEDFDTVNGPALYIYLSSDLGTGDFVNLGEIKATKGSVNYEIPAGTDVSKYNKVLVWCEPFSVLFSYAELK